MSHGNRIAATTSHISSQPSNEIIEEFLICLLGSTWWGFALKRPEYPEDTLFPYIIKSSVSDPDSFIPGPNPAF